MKPGKKTAPPNPFDDRAFQLPGRLLACEFLLIEILNHHPDPGMVFDRAGGSLDLSEAALHRADGGAGEAAILKTFAVARENLDRMAEAVRRRAVKGG